MGSMEGNDLKKESKMREQLLLSLLLLQVALAETNTFSAWSRYTQNPTEENAKKVQNVKNGDIDKGLLVLKKQIEKGSRESLKLAIRFELSDSAGLDGGAAEMIPELISLGAKVNAKDYIEILQELGVKTCLVIEPYNVEKYVDGMNRDLLLADYKERYKNFSYLKKSLLQQKCTKQLKSEMLVLEKQLNSLYVGVLEVGQCQINATQSTKILFQKQGDNFNVFNEIFEPLMWHIAFDGKYFGTTKKKMLKIKNRPHAFTGWCSSPKYRPIVIVSKKNFKDPEKWKPFTPKREIVKRLFPLFKKRVGQLEAIDFETKRERTFDYTQKDVLLQKSYKNNRGERLIQLGFEVSNLSSEGKSPAWFKNYWFYVKGKSIKFIDTNLELVDAGDYDNNGQSEVLFWKSDYNRDGYELFYDHFEKSVLKSWGYH